MTESVREQLLEVFEHLTQEQQQRLLNTARLLQVTTTPPGTPGELLLTALPLFAFAPGEVDAMMNFIDMETEDINPDDWR